MRGIELKNLTKYYKDTKALEALSHYHGDDLFLRGKKKQVARENTNLPRFWSVFPRFILKGFTIQSET